MAAASAASVRLSCRRSLAHRADEAGVSAAAVREKREFNDPSLMKHDQTDLKSGDDCD